MEQARQESPDRPETAWHDRAPRRVTVGRPVRRSAGRIPHPVPMLIRGVRRGCVRFVAWYRATPPERRRVTLGTGAIAIAALCFWHYGPPLLAVIAVVGACRLGYDRRPKAAEAARAARESRLQALYNGLVPYLADDHDPDRRFVPGGGFAAAFAEVEAGRDGGLTGLTIRYSPFFRDGEAESRLRVERAIEGKLGRRNEYLYDWDEEGNRLVVRVLAPLPAGISGAPWHVRETEYVLGFTDAAPGARLIPATVTSADGTARRTELAPVTWCPDAAVAARHLLVCGSRGTGRTNALRAIAAQAIAAGHAVAVIDTGRGGAYGGLGLPTREDGTAASPNARRRPARGAARVETDTAAALGLLDWFAGQCARGPRTELADGRDGLTDTLPPASRLPLWLIVDELPALCDAALRLRLPDPQDIVNALMRGSGAHDATLVIGCDAARVHTLDRALLAGAGTRVGLGRLTEEASIALFDGTLDIGGAAELPPGRGYVRHDAGPVTRLQVPHAGGTGTPRGRVPVAVAGARR